MDVGNMKDKQRALCESLADKMGRQHANPIIRSMYPETSRGDMSRQFAQLFTLGFAAGVESESVRTAKFVNAIKSAEMFGTMAPDEARPVLVYVLNLLRSALKEFNDGV